MDKLELAKVMIKAYAESAEECSQHARARSSTADGTARRLWLEEERVERARAEAFRMALAAIAEVFGEVSAPALATECHHEGR
jgi:hypothetical protein